MSGSDVSDGEAANSRSSANRIAMVVSKFDDLKRKLVSDISFQGMLKVPQIKFLDRKFTLWLLNQIDTKKRAIILNETTHIEITAEDVHQFLDIPIGPNKLFGLEDRSPSEKMDFIRLIIGSASNDIDEKNSLKAAEEIVSAEFPDGMNANNQEQFQVSFVCFCMGNFLLGKYSLNHGIKDFWGSLINPAEIPKFNFCEAVVDELMEAARHVQRESKANRPIKNVSGCNLFLQAKYLEFINSSMFASPTREIPIIQYFNAELMKKMITSANVYTTPKLSKPIESVKNKQVTRLGFQSGKSAKQSSFIDHKSRSSSLNLHQSLHSRRNESSSSYLLAYTRGEFERKLNLKQIDDLKIHNARMRLFVHNFKTRTLSDLRASCFDISHSSKEAMFLTSVDNLLNQLLDQVLVLSKRLHEHSDVIPPAPVLCTPALPSLKRSSDNSDIGIEGSSNKRQAKPSFLYGRNLLPELTSVAGTPAISKTPSNFSKGTGYGSVTPETRTVSPIIIVNNSADSTVGLEDLEFKSSNEDEETDVKHSSGLNFKGNFTTPDQQVGLNSCSLMNTECRSHSGPFDGIFPETNELDLNETPINNDITDSPLTKITISKGRMARNPWFYATPMKMVEAELAAKLYSSLGETQSSSLDSLWIIHHSPRLIKIAGNDFKSVFTRGFNLTRDVIDLGIRRFEQMDRFMYGEGVHLRWIHPFESDFAIKALNDEVVLNSRSIRLQLIKSALEYQICQCRMIAVPIEVNLSWACYFWDMKERIVHIVDPTFNSLKADQFHELHSPIVDKLQQCIQTCIAAVYDGWEIDWNNWQKKYAQPFLSGRTSKESGLLTLLALRYFNGSKFEISQSQQSLDLFAKDVLYNMLSIEGNQGKIPEIFIQVIE